MNPKTNQTTKQTTPHQSKAKLYIGILAWLTVYGGGALFLLYMLFALLMDLT